MQVVISKNQEKNRYFHLLSSLEKVGKYVRRGKKCSIANAIVENTSLRGEVVSSLPTRKLKGNALTLMTPFYA